MLNHTDPEPYFPRRLPGTRYKWKAISTLDYCIPYSKFTGEFEDIFYRRRTVIPSKPLPITESCSLLKSILQYKEIGLHSSTGLAKRPTISPGALQTISGILISQEANPIIYDAETDKFLILPINEKERFLDGVNTIKKIQENADGDLILFVSDLGVIKPVYKNYLTLVYRECGATLQAFSMAAYAAGHAFVPLGVHGNNILKAIAPESEMVIGVSCGLLGKPS